MSSIIFSEKKTNKHTQKKKKKKIKCRMSFATSLLNALTFNMPIKCLAEDMF